MPVVQPGFLWSYGPVAEAIGLGTAGGGPDIPGLPTMPTLGWEELARVFSRLGTVTTS
jgi:hypothetical protein